LCLSSWKGRAGMSFVGGLDCKYQSHFYLEG
jgi:hypothetical protein